MDCLEAREQLELLVLGELPDAQRAALAAHLRVCPDCRAAEVELGELVGQIQQAAEPVAPNPDFRRSVRSVTHAEVRTAARRSRLRRVVVAVGSAAVLLVGVVLWRPSGVGTQQPPTPVVHVSANSTLAHTPRTSDGRVPLSVIWQHKDARAVPASVAEGIVVRGATIFALMRDAHGAHVAALDAATGQVRWQSTTRSLGQLAADASRVYGVSSGPRGTVDLVALGAGDGRLVWRYTPERARRAGTLCAPVVLGGNRVCWTAGTTLAMIDATSGQAVWTRAMPDCVRLSGAAAMGRDVYVASGCGLHCLDADSGRERWRQAFGDEKPGWSRPLLAADDGRVYAVLHRRNNLARLLSMDLAGRCVLWTRDVPRATHLLVTGNGLYLRTQDVGAFSKTTGRRLWTCRSHGCGALTWADGLLHFVDSGQPGRLVALDPRTGTKAWDVPGLRSCDAFVRAGPTGYLKTQDGVLYAFAMNARAPY